MWRASWPIEGENCHSLWLTGSNVVPPRYVVKTEYDFFRKSWGLVSLQDQEILLEY